MPAAVLNRLRVERDRQVHAERFFLGRSINRCDEPR